MYVLKHTHELWSVDTMMKFSPTTCILGIEFKSSSCKHLYCLSHLDGHVSCFLNYGVLLLFMVGYPYSTWADLHKWSCSFVSEEIISACSYWIWISRHQHRYGSATRDQPGSLWGGRCKGRIVFCQSPIFRPVFPGALCYITQQNVSVLQRGHCEGNHIWVFKEEKECS